MDFETLVYTKSYGVRPYGMGFALIQITVLEKVMLRKME
jgi:hypothetical protein